MSVSRYSLFMAKRFTGEEFIARAKEIHGDRYDYSRIEYVNAHTYVTIGCKKHGFFEQEPTNHIFNGRGCPICSHGGEAEERFWKFVDKKGDAECWNWVGKKGHGYGRFWYNGKTIRAHRFSYELFFGNVPDCLFVLHKCDNPGCVNPDHLFLGTLLDNSRDMIAKGRGGDQKGEKNPAAKLTMKDVLEIRSLYASGNFTQKQIAQKYNIALSTANQIIIGKRWKHDK